ncbi:AraC-like DNA-binding protein [Zymomonas mobilis]|uniref:AraC family transcriptional regulator n=1 Tax=Zymomonas mobilis TaxID=542 RepID=UPI00026D8209|nr:AraC family transcriptional regulator [Zymomonas mobilis]AFN57599.1 transcriptional regulator, AraC family [Zymomonas mobilis subsp. mobilis ATCC 29191]TQK74371.1 AraC-like DNA-binding protein [Zymomonas mobilis]TQL14622.1 AraC-like DNA-binding protein [Zymomonas mobilis]
MLSMMEGLRDIISRQIKADRYQTVIPELMLFRSTNRLTSLNCIYRSRLYLIVQGSKQVSLGNRQFTYDLITTVDLPVRSAVLNASIENPYLALSVDFYPIEIANLLLSMPQEEDEIFSTTSGMAVGTIDALLLKPIYRLISLLDTPGDIAVLSPLIRKEIYYRLLQGSLGSRLKQIAIADSHISHIARVLDWIKQHYAEPSEVKMLAAIANMSEPSFFRHFKAVTMMSPIQYRTQIRLHEARQKLLISGEDVSSVAFAVGYESPSQFSREYKRMFEITPSQDISRFRK